MPVLLEWLRLSLLALLSCAFSLWLGWVPAPWIAEDWQEQEWISLESLEGHAVLWVDTRSAMDYEIDHVPGAVHLNRDKWGSGVMELMLNWLENPRIIVVYCAEADCGASKRLVARLREAVTGAEIYSLEGGWEVLATR